MTEVMDLPENKVTKSAASVLIHDGMVVLVEEGEGSSHITGMLGLPSGRPEPGETSIENAVREFREETGLTSDPHDFVDFDNNIFHASILRKSGKIEDFEWHVYRVTNFSGELTQQADNVIPRWVEISQLQKLQDEGKLLPNVLNAVQGAMMES